MSAKSKEGFSAPDSPGESDSRWDILTEYSKDQAITEGESSSEQENVKHESPNVEPENVEDVEVEDATIENPRVIGDIREAKPSPEQIKIKRLRRALDIIEAYYFDGVSISPKDQAFIDEMGGKEAMIKRMAFEMSKTYDKFSLMKIYFQNKNKLSKRQRVAIRYWANEHGMSIETYMNSEQARYGRERNIAVGIVRRELIDTGKFEYDELSLNDAGAVYNFDEKELIRSAKRQMYDEKRKEILPYLASRRVNNRSGYMPDREAKFAIEYLMQKTGLTREQLERRMASYAQEVYLPSRIQERESQAFVESKANLISDSDLERCVDALGRPPREDISSMLVAVENVVSRKLGLINAGLTIRIETNPLTTGSSGEYGSYNPDTKTVIVYAGYIIDRERNIAGRDYALFRCCNTMSHELFHAYQDLYKKKYDDKRAQMYEINNSDYISGSGPGETHADYERQLLEREAWHFGGTVSKRMRTIFGRKKGFSL